MYCVDVVVTPAGFALQICRRDEGRWQVIRRSGEHLDREEAAIRAREIVATFE
jgi:hypothetical protein